MTREDKRSGTSKTGKTVLYDIQTTRGDISNMRRSVSCDIIQASRSYIYQSRGVFYMKSKHREVIYQTREKVFYRICKDRKVINKTRESVFYLILNTERCHMSNTRRSFYLIFKKQIPRLEKSEA